MTKRLKRGVMNHLGPEASIHFEPQDMKFVGRIETPFGPEKFEAQSTSLLVEGYERAVERMTYRKKLLNRMIYETANFEELIQSGEAMILVNPDDSERELGSRVKILLSLADGAGFQIQAKSSAEL